MRERPFEQWARDVFKTFAKCDILLNNISEYFNKYILKARERPLLTMMEIIRSQVMKRITTKQAVGRKMKGDICPKIRKKLDIIIDMSYEYHADFAGSSKAQVRGPEGQFSVDLDKRSCACRRWDLTAIPCVHAVAAIIEQMKTLFHMWINVIARQCTNKCTTT